MAVCGSSDHAPLFDAGRVAGGGRTHGGGSVAGAAAPDISSALTAPSSLLILGCLRQGPATVTELRGWGCNDLLFPINSAS
jgi:hypothetical protein